MGVDDVRLKVILKNYEYFYIGCSGGCSGGELSAKLKKDFLRLLEKDVEFRTALVGLIGFEELRRAYVRLEESISGLARAQKETEEEIREFAGGLSRLERAVEELSMAQKRTEERLVDLATRLEDLAAAQKGTEERLGELAIAQRRTEERLGELAEAQKRTEERLEGLAIAQKRTEERLEELAMAQKRTEERLEELAMAQKRTEERLGNLTAGLEDLAAAQKRTEERLGSLTARLEELATAQRRTEEALRNLAIQVGQLSDVIGFGLEDIARVVVPSWLHRHEDIVVEELYREILVIDGEEIEVNLYGEGLKAGEKIVILGEVKSRIYRRDVEEFVSKLEKIEKLIDAKKYRLMFGYYIHPSAKELAEESEIKLIASYMR